jgi:hypothetical protein
MHKLITSPNIEYKVLTAKAQDAAKCNCYSFFFIAQLDRSVTVAT